MHTLDTQEISKDLEYPKCVKKLVKNWICISGFNQTFIFENRYKIIIFQLIIIFQQFQVVQLIDVMMLNC